jgi:prevent-host-death family protein
MTQVTIHQAKTNLSSLIQKALQGEEVVIANRNQPVVKLQVITINKTQRRIGGLKHWKILPSFSWSEWKKMDREIEKDFLKETHAQPISSAKKSLSKK